MKLGNKRYHIINILMWSDVNNREKIKRKKKELNNGNSLKLYLRPRPKEQ